MEQHEQGDDLQTSGPHGGGQDELGPRCQIWGDHADGQPDGTQRGCAVGQRILERRTGGGEGETAEQEQPAYVVAKAKVWRISSSPTGSRPTLSGTLASRGSITRVTAQPTRRSRMTTRSSSRPPAVEPTDPPTTMRPITSKREPSDQSAASPMTKPVVVSAATVWKPASIGLESHPSKPRNATAATTPTSTSIWSWGSSSRRRQPRFNAR